MFFSSSRCISYVNLLQNHYASNAQRRGFNMRVSKGCPLHFNWGRRRCDVGRSACVPLRRAVALPVGGQTDWSKGHSGDSGHFPLAPPLSNRPPTPPAARVMDEGIEHTAGGPTDTWVPLRESASHLVTLFHSLSPNALWAFSKGHFYIGIRCFTSFTLAVFIFDVRSHAKMEKCSDPGRPWNADNCKYQR